MAESHTLYNGGPMSVVYDSEGHTVEPGDRVEGNPNGRVLGRLVADGQLTDLGPTGRPVEDGFEVDSGVLIEVDADAADNN